MSRLVDDLLDASRIATGKVRLAPQRLDLAALTRSVAGDHRPELEAGGLTLTIDTPEVPVWVRGDAARLAQVIGNLLHNSLKFTNPGGRVTVRLAGEGGTATIAVIDSGVGIHASALPKLFDAFSQAESSIERSKGGLGLGLSVVKGLIELHGGRVFAASEGAGRGAAFSVTVPLDGLAPEKAGAAAEAVASLRRSDADRLRVLIVEDSPDSAESLRMLLAVKGFQVVAVAHTGPDGVEAAVRLRPDAVVCDLGLPGMSGFEVARALRGNPATSACLLVCLTGYGQEQDRQRALEAGFDEVVVKAATDRDALERVLTRGHRGAAHNS
jgi:CheY-like chemotaxis protein